MELTVTKIENVPWQEGCVLTCEKWLVETTGLREGDIRAEDGTWLFQALAGATPARAALASQAPALADLLKEFLIDQECLQPPFRNEALCEKATALLRQLSLI